MPFESSWNITLQFRNRNVSNPISSWSVNYYETHSNVQIASNTNSDDLFRNAQAKVLFTGGLVNMNSDHLYAMQ